jgi:hypothetical protein
MKLFYMLFLGLSIFSLLSGCVYKDCTQQEVDFGYKKIFIGDGASILLLGDVIEDWDDIADSIHDYKPRKCIESGLTVELIDALDVYSGEERKTYISKAGRDAEDDSIMVLSIGTGSLCVRDESESGPTWVVLYDGESYLVVDELSISE